jgi:hypothetical protein
METVRRSRWVASWSRSRISECAIVLDGQQRLTSLFATLKGMKVTRASEAVDDFSAVYLDLEAKSHEQIVITDLSAKKELRAFG